MTAILLRDIDGRRPVFGENALFNDDPYWRDLIDFHEYFHGDNAATAMKSLVGTPEDIAALTALLVSRDADWLTGRIISVDGGRSTLRTKN